VDGSVLFLRIVVIAGVERSVKPPFKIIVEEVNIKKSILIRVRGAFLCVLVFALGIVVKTSHHPYCGRRTMAKMGSETC